STRRPPRPKRDWRSDVSPSDLTLRPDFLATCTVAAVNASESAPPERATHNSPVTVWGVHRGSANSSRTARRTSATAAWGPLTEPAHPATHATSHRNRTPSPYSVVHPTQPIPRTVDLRTGGERVRRRPYGVETVH